MRPLVGKEAWDVPHLARFQSGDALDKAAGQLDALDGAAHYLKQLIDQLSESRGAAAATGNGTSAFARRFDRIERQEVALVRAPGNNVQASQIWRGSFPFSGRLCTRRVVITRENNSQSFSPERYREYLHLLARLRRRMSASDVIHETILKAHKNREQFRGRTEAEYRAWLRRILANIIADAAQGREADILQALDRSSAVLEEWVVAEGPSPAERLEWTCRPLSRTGVFPFCRSSAPAPVTS